MDAEAGREPMAPNANAGPPHPSRRPRAAMTLTIVGVAAVAFVVGLLVRSRRALERPAEPMAETRAGPPARTRESGGVGAVDLASVVDRFHATRDDADRTAAELALRLLEDDPLSDEAHFALGHRQFFGQVPETVSFRDYPFIRAVEDANRLRWLDDPARRRAMNAWAKTLAHARRIAPDVGDPAYRALDGVRRRVAQVPRLKDYVYETVFASPYVLCWTDGERVSPADLDRLPRAERRQRLAGLEAKRATFHRVLAEKARIYRQVYDEFLRRYGQECDLRDLAAPYGGRADLPIGKRSFVDGYAFLVWASSDPTEFRRQHDVSEPISPSVNAFVYRRTGDSVSFDDPEYRAANVRTAVRMGTQQLLDAFRRQKREWAVPPEPPLFFDEGLADYLGAVDMASDRTLAFHGLHADRLAFLRHMKKRRSGGPLLVLPTRDLVSFEGWGQIAEWATRSGRADEPLQHFLAQSWALVHYLHEAHDGQYRARFTRFVCAMLTPPAPEHFRRSFAETFGLESDADWARFDADFERHYRALIDREPSLLPRTPALDDWPGYVTPRMLDLESPEVSAGEDLVPAPR